MKLNKNPKILIFILASIAIPLVTVGYDYLENTTFYDKISGTQKLEFAVEKLYSGDSEDTHGLFKESVIAKNNKEFENLLQIIKTKTDFEENLTPTFIMRFALHNASYIQIPKNLNEKLDHPKDNKQIIIGTDFSPAILGICPPNITEETLSQCKTRIIGNNKYELKNKIEERKKNLRLNFNLIITIISILFAVLTLEKQNKELNIQ